MSTTPQPHSCRFATCKTYFHTEAGIAKAVDGVDFDIFPGEVLGLVGESGSGKSVTALSILRLIPDPPGKIVDGSILFKGRDLLKLSWDEIRADARQRDQHDLSGADDLAESGVHDRHAADGGGPGARARVASKEAFQRSVEMLELVGIPDPASRMNDYPHQFSGGMRQRVMIAMALACNPVAADRRRADDRARRDDPGADSGPDAAR